MRDPQMVLDFLLFSKERNILIGAPEETFRYLVEQQELDKDFADQDLIRVLIEKGAIVRTMSGSSSSQNENGEGQTGFKSKPTDIKTADLTIDGKQKEDVDDITELELDIKQVLEMVNTGS